MKERTLHEENLPTPSSPLPSSSPMPNQLLLLRLDLVLERLDIRLYTLDRGLQRLHAEKPQNQLTPTSRPPQKQHTYVNVLRQQLVRDLVLVDDIIVQPGAREHRAEQEAEESA